jgi:hypothetical protein
MAWHRKPPAPRQRMSDPGRGAAVAFGPAQTGGGRNAVQRLVRFALNFPLPDGRKRARGTIREA